MDKKYNTVALIVLDGWGYREETKDNAIAKSRKPFFDSLWKKYPHTLLSASGLSVGLPEGQIGNSEVGHMTIGAGKIIDTDLVKISKAIVNREFHNVAAFCSLFEHVKKNNSTLHVMGLVGAGGVHSHQEHLLAFLRTAKTAGVSRVAVHAFMDGRDLPPQSGSVYLAELESVLTDLGIGKIATVSGRYYSMDRDKNWDRLKLSLDAIEKGEGEIHKESSPSIVVEEKYLSGEVDEHLRPMVFLGENDEIMTLGENDGVFIFNFRADRVRMISKKLKEEKSKLNLAIVTMTEYEKDLGFPVAFSKTDITTTLAREISSAGLSQAHIAETEKFAHATYFLNGGVEEVYPKEKQILVESRKDVVTHDLAPEMRAKEITDKAIEEVEKGIDFLFINYANLDMVGHTANVPAIIKAAEVVDSQLRRIVEVLDQKNGVAIITADHGNAELNLDQTTGKPHTAHTTNLVPCIITDVSCKLKSEGNLSNLAGTALYLLGLDIPKVMEDRVII